MMKKQGDPAHEYLACPDTGKITTVRGWRIDYFQSQMTDGHELSWDEWSANLEPIRKNTNGLWELP